MHVVVVGEKHDMTIFSVMENGMKKRGERGGGTLFKRGQERHPMIPG